MKILVVDDEHQALSRFLSEVDSDPKRDFKFLSSPTAALEYAAANLPDAAFLDINMPGINGIDLAEKLIEIDSAISIVFISGYAQDKEKIEKRLGKNLLGFCEKPYDGETLCGFISMIEGRAIFDANCFGIFNISFCGKPVLFSCAKSKELLAVLIDRKGAMVSSDIIINALWPDKSVDNAKRLYRDALIRLRLALKKYGLQDAILSRRKECAVNRERFVCDFWTALETKKFSSYAGEYMMQYADWSIETQSFLDRLVGYY